MEHAPHSARASPCATYASQINCATATARGPRQAKRHKRHKRGRRAAERAPARIAQRRVSRGARMLN
ncbi:hypothetical protein WS83_02765 [Burkholderia sp. MSMB2042]|nr:hypothetical protein WS78_27930 [Burkholderia savannae]KVG38565.1 hypothetical protein WS77_20985 [Burkholderia sp. MSMB0265]KVG87209.1 hypothetical protein WS81_28110 [Burkholderia sp. MSMB2040]KVG94732.1 hypothetical protein WS82_06730 [Burkholderia sp. MSMB2041]KVG96560.1 hypothetical protein WS83_02765 [Burkholderia sp. MSMB2042]